MANLNIKGFPDELYKELQAAAERDHRSLSQQVIHLLSASVRRKPSIAALRGLGKELWQGLDVDAHVERERSSWD